MFEHFIEELLAVWAYLWLSPEERRELLREQEPEEQDEEKGDSSDQNQE